MQGTLNILQEGHWTETSENNFLPVCVQNLKDNSSIILMPCESSFNYDDGYVRYQLQRPKKAAVKVFILCSVVLTNILLPGMGLVKVNSTKFSYMS
jgi:hypothetical protein